jgi:hypothetical protein
MLEMLDTPRGMLSPNTKSNMNPFSLPMNMLVNKEIYLLDPDSYDRVSLRGEIIKQINSSYIMATSDIKLLEKLYNNIEVKLLEPGEMLLTMGVKSESIYMIYAGSLVYMGMDDEGLMADMFRYEDGDLIGEIYMNKDDDEFCMGIIKASTPKDRAKNQTKKTVIFELKLEGLDKEYTDLVLKKIKVTTELIDNFEITRLLKREEKLIIMNRIQMETFQKGDLIIREVINLRSI